MALGDIVVLADGNGFGQVGSTRYKVAASATQILAGEPVAKALGNASGSVVTPAATNTPVVATDFYAGIASSNSTNTASLAGVVDVLNMDTKTTYLITPKVSTSWDTQAEYDALVGARVLLDLTSGSYTILATDGATSGCVIAPLDIVRYPGKVAFNFRSGVSFLT